MKKKTLFALLVTCSFCIAAFAQKHDTITTASGLKYFYVHHGDGPLFKPGYIAIQEYILTLADGTPVDNTRERGVPFATVYPSTHLIKGSVEAILLMHIGDRAIFIMPPDIAYGKRGAGKAIPPNATLVFDIELTGMKAKSVQQVLDSVMFGKPVRPDSIPHTAEVIKTYKKLKKAGFNDLYSSEEDLNLLGYGVIKKYPNDAVELFKLNVKMYPKSFNVYDSLGEGYMDIGDTRRAIKNYQKSLELNPKNTNATDMINKMKAAK